MNQIKELTVHEVIPQGLSVRRGAENIIYTYYERVGDNFFALDIGPGYKSLRSWTVEPSIYSVAPGNKATDSQLEEWAKKLGIPIAEL